MGPRSPMGPVSPMGPRSPMSPVGHVCPGGQYVPCGPYGPLTGPMSPTCWPLCYEPGDSGILQKLEPRARALSIPARATGMAKGTPAAIIMQRPIFVRFGWVGDWYWYHTQTQQAKRL